ncbi:MAG: hypothetical protein ACXVXT_05220 [Blastococcus sp.]
MSTTAQATRTSTGSAVERRGWWLLALLTAVMVVFGLEAFFAQPSPTEVIAGSGCCNGHALSEAPPWVYDYAGELARYMGTFMVGTGVFGLAVVFGGLRHGRRWAWYVAWYVPILFAVHAFVLGSFPFDAVTLALALVGLLLMARPVFGAAGRPQPVGDHPESAPVG